MKKDSVMGKLPYVRPAIETCDFRVESGIAQSFQDPGNKAADDFIVSGWWDEK